MRGHYAQDLSSDATLGMSLDYGERWHESVRRTKRAPKSVRKKREDREGVPKGTRRRE